MRRTTAVGMLGAVVGVLLRGPFGFDLNYFSLVFLLSLIGSAIFLGLYVMFSAAAGLKRVRRVVDDPWIRKPTDSQSWPSPNVESVSPARPEPGARRPPGTPEEIFLSYASPDRELAKALASALQAEGWSVWWDRTIPPGAIFDEVIESALSAARCVVVLWSKDSVVSNWVKNEAREAVKRRILIPATVAEVTIPFEFRHIQVADLTG
jgi:hypothetical protein